MKNLQLPLPGLALIGLLTFSVACNKNEKTTHQNNREDTPVLAEDTTKTQTLSQDELLKQGRHLVMSIGCDDCHTPKNYANGQPEPDMSKHMAGHMAGEKLPPYDQKTVDAGWTLGNRHFTAWVGPWGTSFSANLTPDKETGIGNWTEENFFRSIREGKFHGLTDSRPILPPMPWPSYRNLTDDELRSIFTYLKSVKPIKNAVPEALPPKAKS